MGETITVGYCKLIIGAYLIKYDEDLICFFDNQKQLAVFKDPQRIDFNLKIQLEGKILNVRPEHNITFRYLGNKSYCIDIVDKLKTWEVEN